MKRTTIPRRELLRVSLQSLGAAFATGLLRPSFLYATGRSAPQNGRSLVIIIKEGGEDTAYTQPPLGSIASTLASVRPTISVAPSQALDWLDNQIGLHPLYAPLEPLAHLGNIKIIRACGFPDHSRSHQQAQNHLSHAARHLTGQQATEGWPAKLKNFYDLTTYQVVGFHTGNRLELKSQRPSLSLEDLESYSFRDRDWQLGHTGGSALSRQALFNLLLTISEPQSHLEDQAKMTLQKAPEAISVVEEVRGTSLGTIFPTTRLGGDLANIAKMIKWRATTHGPENAIYLVKVTDYDTHSEQASRLNALISQEAYALRALFDELSLQSAWNDTAVMLVSEFSRTFQENSGRGTDHAQATNVTLLGGRVAGGGAHSVYGPLYDAKDILARNSVTAELYYQDIVAEVLRWWGASEEALNAALPERSRGALDFSLFR